MNTTLDQTSAVVVSNFSCGRWNLTKEENEFQEVYGWWVQSFASLIIGSFGIIVNMVTIVVLSTKELRKLFFNKLLIGLTIFDNLFLMNCLYESVRLHIIKTDYCALHGHLLIVLRPFRYISMCCSIYMTLVLTFERYLAVVRPIRHRNRFIGSSHGKRLIKYVSPVIILSMIFCTPEFFALRFVHQDDISIIYSSDYTASNSLNLTNEDIRDNVSLNIQYSDSQSFADADYSLDTDDYDTNNHLGNLSYPTRLQHDDIIDGQGISVTYHNTSSNFAEDNDLYCLIPSEMMSNRNYVLWYKNVANLIITGTLPFFLLAFFNYKIYMTTKSAIQTRGELFLSVECTNANTSHKTKLTSNKNGPSHCPLSKCNSSVMGEGDDPIRSQINHGKDQKSEEQSQATVLLGIVITFFICHVLRIVLNVEEIVSFEELTRIQEEANNNNEICSGVQLWTMLTNDVSHLLLQLNSSITFFIYLYFSTQFKDASKSIFLLAARYLHLYNVESGMDRFNERGEMRGGRYRYNSSINTKTTNSFSTPPETFRRNQCKNQSLQLSKQPTDSTESTEIVQTNNGTSVYYSHHAIALERMNSTSTTQDMPMNVDPF